jgi:hypothetical protein
MTKEELPAGYTQKDNSCACCGTITKNVFKINGYLVKGCSFKHADRRINNIYSLLKFVK